MAHGWNHLWSSHHSPWCLRRPTVVQLACLDALWTDWVSVACFSWRGVHVMTRHPRHALLHNPSGEAPVGALWGNDVSHPLLPLAQVRHPFLGQCENSGIFSNAALISWAAPGIPAGVLPSVAVLVGQFNTRGTGEGPGIGTANVGWGR